MRCLLFFLYLVEETGKGHQKSVRITPSDGSPGPDRKASLALLIASVTGSRDNDDLTHLTVTTQNELTRLVNFSGPRPGVPGSRIVCYQGTPVAIPGGGPVPASVSHPLGSLDWAKSGRALCDVLQKVTCGILCRVLLISDIDIRRNWDKVAYKRARTPMASQINRDQFWP